jgi:glycerol kinase
MTTGLLLGIDHGGTTTTALLLDPDTGKRVSRSVPMPKSAPRPGWVEHDPEDFFRTSLAASEAALAAAGRTWEDVAAVGIANQGETSMAWLAGDGGPLGPALSWEDRRSAELCRELDEQGVGELVRERTGVLLDAYFSASKFRWLLDNVPEVARAARDGSLRLGGTDSYVIDRLTSGRVHATDPATGSRTALYNIRNLDWDDDLLSAFGLDRAWLPDVRATAGDFGTISCANVAQAGVPITTDAVDAHAALFAQACWDATVVKATYGTGAFIEVNTGEVPVVPDGKLPVFIAWQLDGRIDYTIEGGVFAVGSAVDWMVGAGFLASAQASSALAESVSDSGGVVMVPSFTGLSAPHWKTDARAAIFGLGLDTTPAHVARALLDGIAFQCAEIVHALNMRVDGAIFEVRADGGPSNNSYLMQRQADLLGLPVAVSLERDMTALGAALLAGLGAGLIARSDIGSYRADQKIFEPAIGDDEREASWHGWQASVTTVAQRE